MRTSRRALLLISLLPLACDAPKASEPKAKFSAGREAACNADYKEALEHLEAYVALAPQGKLASRARLFIGKAQLGLGDHAQARAAFEQVLAEHPGSPEAPKARYKLALLTLLDGKPAEAAQQFKAISDDPQGSPLAGESAALAAYLGSATGGSSAVPKFCL